MNELIKKELYKYGWSRILNLDSRRVKIWIWYGVVCKPVEPVEKRKPWLELG